MYYVYLLMGKNKRTYLGCTADLRKRIERHNKGYVSATKENLPVKLVAYFALNDKYKAYCLEKYLKSGSGRAFLNKRII